MIWTSCQGACHAALLPLAAPAAGRPRAAPAAALVARARRTVHDRLAPSLVRLTPLSYRLERELVRGILIGELPSKVKPGWLAALLASECPVAISLHVVEELTPLMLQAVTSVIWSRLRGRRRRP